MAIDTMDKLVAGLASSQQFSFFFPSATNAASGWVDLNRAVVTSFGQQAIPAAASAGGTLHDNSQVGFPLGQNPTPPALSYLAQWRAIATVAGSVHLYDKVWSCTGFSGIVITAQAVTSFPVLTRPSVDGDDLEIWIESYTATGATASNITVQYTNSAGVAGRNTISTPMIASMPANRMFQVPLQANDFGVKSIQSITLSASTGTAGAFGVTLMKRISSIAMPLVNLGATLDFASLGMPIIQDNSALTFVHQATTTSSGIIMGQMNVIQG